MPLTIEDPRTGEKINPYLGGDPIDPPASQEKKEDAPSTTTAADPAAPATDPAAPTDADGASAVRDEPGDSVVHPDDEVPQRDAKGRFIPKARFDEVNERRKKAEERLAQLEAEKNAANNSEAYDFDAAEKQYADLLLDGKVEEALAKRKEIRAAEQAHFEKVATERAAGTARQLSVQEQITEIASSYESQYDAFNPESESFSEDVLDDVQVLYTGYLKANKYDSAAEAFEAAVKRAIKMHDLKPKAAPATSTTPTAKPRTAQTRVEAIVKQPPLMAKAGASNVSHGDSTYKPSEMTEAELLRLPEAERRRLRGDFL